MSFPVAIALPDVLNEGRKKSLISLLSDEDLAVYQTVREKIISYGTDVVGWLKPYALNNDPLIRRRTQEIVDLFLRRNADDDFLSFCLTESADLDLERGVWMLSQTRYPNININAYEAVLDGYAADLREKIDPKSEAATIFGTLNEYFFGKVGFKGNEQNYYDPENSYLNRVMDRKMGNPISMCLVYLLLARRLQLPVTGIGLPGHFICRYQTPTEEYYIDVFNQGKLWTKANCIQYLIFRNYNLQDEYLAPVNSRRMLNRVCGNLHQIYQQLENPGESTRLQRYIFALSK